MLGKDTIKNALILALSGVAEHKSENEIWINQGAVNKAATIELVESDDDDTQKSIVRAYFKEGHLRYMADYVGCKRHGDYKEWNRKGDLWVTGQYMDDKRHGLFKNHLTERTIEYKKGKPDLTNLRTFCWGYYANIDYIKYALSKEEEDARVLKMANSVSIC